MSLRDDQTRLRHMHDAAIKARHFAEGHTRLDLDTDDELVYALVKAIEIIGEAAAHVSERAQEEYPEIPWFAMIGMRNRLIHGYDDIDLNLVWDTIVDDLPPLLATLQRIL